MIINSIDTERQAFKRGLYEMMYNQRYTEQPIPSKILIEDEAPPKNKPWYHQHKKSKY